jgi:transcriptional regulator GlxA family with amidase domain
VDDKQSRLILIVAVQPVRVFEIAALMEVFGEANRGNGGNAKYEVRVISAGSTSHVMSQSGLSLQTNLTYQDWAASADTILVTGFEGSADVQMGEDFLAWLRQHSERSRRFGSVSNGAHILAKAGLLDRRRATTHWKWDNEFWSHYPAIAMERDVIYIRDGNCYTSAGGSAAIDLALALVEEDLGKSIADRVAQAMLVFMRRSGGQRQLSATLLAQSSESKPLASLLTWLPDNLQQDLSIRNLARRAAMSPRNFARRFRRQVGTTPARHVENLRLEAAQRQLESTALSVNAVADACGFANTETLTRVFTRRLGLTPARYRANKMGKDLLSHSAAA